MNLKLSKPLAFFDLETTGINVGKDKIVEICILKVQKDGSEECKTWRVNPGIPIPKESSDVHGITDDMVKDCPTFAELAVEIHNFIKTLTQDPATQKWNRALKFCTELPFT